VATIITLADLRAHLRYTPTDTTDDVALMGFIGAADDVVTSECGDVLPTFYDEYYDGGHLIIYLKHRPLLEINNVEEGWGWQNHELDYQQVNTVPAGALYAYSVDSRIMASISRRSAGNVNIPFVSGVKNIRVQYTAGRNTVPAAVRLFALELVAYWWRNSQARAMTSATTTTQFAAVNQDFTRAQGVSSFNLGVPAGLLELIKPFRRLPVMA